MLLVVLIFHFFVAVTCTNAIPDGFSEEDFTVLSVTNLPGEAYERGRQETRQRLRQQQLDERQQRWLEFGVFGVPWRRW